MAAARSRRAMAWFPVSAFKKRRMQSGKVKAEQIRATGAKTLVVPCHNCYDQLRDLDKEYDLGIKVVHFKTIIPHVWDLPDHLKPPEEHA